jgi:hypothetical protein
MQIYLKVLGHRNTSPQCVILLNDHDGKYGNVLCSAPHKIIFYHTFVVSTGHYCHSQYKHDYLLPFPIIYVLVPCSVMGPGLQHNTRIIRDESLETDGIVAAIHLTKLFSTYTIFGLKIRRSCR